MSSSSNSVGSGSTSRPVTSKARGICKYYSTERGCFAGRTCKFLHGPVATHTPYDQAKTCHFYAAGFCKRGAQCWFSHTKGKEKEVIEEEDDLCSICFEKPITYGLLNGCGHIFCITCIKQWRDPINKTEAGAGNTKLCPMCRQPAKFIIPSSKFHPHGEAKDAVIARYMESMARVPCRHFQRSLSTTPPRPFCPFGKDCFYQHRNLDGSEHVTDQGVDACMRVYAARREAAAGAPVFPHRSDLIRSLEHVFAETARLGLNPPIRGWPNDGLEDETTVMRRLELLADQMLASLTGQGATSDSDGESDEEEVEMPPLERISDNHQAEDWPLPMMFDTDSDEMPALASVSNSSDSEPSEDEDRDSSSEDHEDAPDERTPAVRPFDLEFDPGMDARNENGGMFGRFSNLWAVPGARESEAALAESTTRGGDAALDPVPVDEGDNDGDEADDEDDMPPLEREPPFVTDGRGRVVWSSPSGPSSSAGRGSDPIPGAFPSGSSSRTPPEKPSSPRLPTGGFTTDGRGRVIGTTGSRAEGEDEDEDAEVQESDAPPTRSFLGRVLGAFF